MTLILLCKHGHEFTPENTYVDTRGYKYCRACERKRGNDRYRRGRESIQYHPRGMSVRERLLDRIFIDPITVCWNWAGSKAGGGYGLILVAGRVRGVHVLSYETFIGPIPDGLEIDHLCRNKGCINPEHLEAVTHRVNILRGNGITAKKAQQTICKWGHEFTPENTYATARGGRDCRACKRKQNRDRYERSRKLSSGVGSAA